MSSINMSPWVCNSPCFSFLKLSAIILSSTTSYAFYASWQTSLILLAVVPVMSASVLFFVKMNQSQTKRANESYAEAGSIVYMAVSAVRTVLSLNAVQGMIDKYARATEKAYQVAVRSAPLLGIANGCVMGSIFGLRNIALYVCTCAQCV